MKRLIVKTFAIHCDFPPVEVITGNELVVRKEVQLSSVGTIYTPEIVAPITAMARRSIIAGWPDWIPKQEPIVKTYIY